MLHMQLCFFCMGNFHHIQPTAQEKVLDCFGGCGEKNACSAKKAAEQLEERDGNPSLSSQGEYGKKKFEQPPPPRH